MIIEKTWERFAKDSKGLGSGIYNYIDSYRGWFLFGFIPLFIRRERTRR